MWKWLFCHLFPSGWARCTPTHVCLEVCNHPCTKTWLKLVLKYEKKEMFFINEWSPAVKPAIKILTSAELVIEHYKFEACKTFSIKVLIWLRSVVVCLSRMQKCRFLWEGLCSSPGHKSLEEPPDPTGFLEEIMTEAKWFLAEPIMLFNASTFMFKILSTQVFKRMTAEALLRLSEEPLSFCQGKSLKPC